MAEHLEWLPELQKLTETGHAFGITSASDDTTNPPLMQKWFHASVPGAVWLEFEVGWGHLHILPPENIERCFAFLQSGVDIPPQLP